MDEIPALTSNAHVERPDRDPRRQQDPHARRRHKPKEPQPSTETQKAEDPADPTPRIVGSRLDVRA